MNWRSILGAPSSSRGNDFSREASASIEERGAGEAGNRTETAAKTDPGISRPVGESGQAGGGTAQSEEQGEPKLPKIYWKNKLRAKSRKSIKGPKL